MCTWCECVCVRSKVLNGASSRQITGVQTKWQSAYDGKEENCMQNDKIDDGKKCDPSKSDGIKSRMNKNSMQKGSQR